MQNTLIALIGGAGAGLGILFAPAKEIKLELKLMVIKRPKRFRSQMQGLSEE
jgi:hypothetical protein